MTKIVIEPVTRIEGHLRIEVITENNEIKEARSSGTLFRGLEIILQGRDPGDAPIYTQRICGLCTTSHSMASALTLDSAFGIADEIPDNGRILRNLILGAAHIADHILHFYHLAILDYVDMTRIASYNGGDSTLNSIKRLAEADELRLFTAGHEGDYRLSDKANMELVAHYIKALEMRRKAQEMLSIFGGKMPHNMAIIPGGVTTTPSTDKMLSFLWRLNELRDFINNVYIPDILTIAEAYSDYFEIGAGCGNLLSYGNFELDDEKRFLNSGTVSTELKLSPLDIDKIWEQVKYSWYANSTAGRQPRQAETKPEPNKKGAYSWIKAPRYDGKAYEAGPLARIMVNYANGNQVVKNLVDPALAQLKLSPKAMFSVFGRHIARALYAKLVADAMPAWLLQLRPEEPAYIKSTVPEQATGMGLIEAARGALGHWIEIKDHKIANYQCITPSTWNLSPKDDRGQPGPMEQALIGTKMKDENTPLEIGRIIRSFDPCLACAVHLITPKGGNIDTLHIT